jgi:citrate lyase subunit beta / citryl-CoA lyase
MTPGRFRSLLFAPANSPRKVAKALASAADGVILDLEDSVALSEKSEARRSAAEALAGRGDAPAFVRVNSIPSGLMDADLAALASAPPDGVILPKVEGPSDLMEIGARLDRLDAEPSRGRPRIEVMPIVETARGLAAVLAIAAGSPRVRRLVFGAIDLALDMDIDLTDETGPIAHARFAVALASRAAGLERPLDTAYADFTDLEGLRQSAMRAKAFGYQGKTCIHPAQIEVINAVFTPTDAELDRARAIVEAFDAAVARGLASVSVDGVMVDYPVALRARRTLAAARVDGA